MAKNVKVVFGNDHRGVALKEHLMIKIMEMDLDGGDTSTFNVGAHNSDSVDYPNISRDLAGMIQRGRDFGILICGSGFGVNIAANRWKGIRAVTCRTQREAKAARLHNDANVLCIGADFTSPEKAVGIMEAFLTSPFDGGERHQRRVDLIDSQ